MNKYTELTKKVINELTSDFILSSSYLYTFRVSNTLVPSVPGDSVYLVVDKNEHNVDEVYLVIVGNNGIEYHLPTEMFTNYNEFGVIEIYENDNEESEDESSDESEDESLDESEDEQSNLEVLIEISTEKVELYNTLVVELNNLKKSSVPSNDEEYVDLVSQISILERELKTLTILIRAEKKATEYAEKNDTKKEEGIDNQINKILSTYEDKYGTDGLASLLGYESDEENYDSRRCDCEECDCEGCDFCLDESSDEDVKLTKEDVKEMLADLIESVQHSETVEKYAAKASELLTAIGISDKNVQDTVKAAKSKAKELKDKLLNELMK